MPEALDVPLTELQNVPDAQLGLDAAELALVTALLPDPDRTTPDLASQETSPT